VVVLDLIGSVTFADALPSRDYCKLLDEFHDSCQKSFYRFNPLRYQVQGDEAVVVLGSDTPYPEWASLQAAYDAKRTFLLQPFNRKRISSQREAVDVAVGIHTGPIYTTGVGRSLKVEGYAIGLAKRLEGLARDGTYTRICVSGQFLSAYNQLVVGDTQAKEMVLFREYPEPIVLKGLVNPVTAHECKSVTMPSRRPPSVSGIKEPMRLLVRAFNQNSRSAWLFQELASLYHAQWMSKKLEGRIAGKRIASVCERFLNNRPHDPYAEYILAVAECLISRTLKGSVKAAFIDRLRLIADRDPSFYPARYTLAEELPDCPERSNLVRELMTECPFSPRIKRLAAKVGCVP